MTPRFFILFCLVFLFACDDGDILTVDLEFDQELERCDTFEDSYIIFDTREDPNEALILIFLRSETTDNFFTNDIPFEDIEEYPITSTHEISTTSSFRFIYRTYNRALTNNDICSILPPFDLIIGEDYESGSGTVQVSFSFIDDDNDGIPSADEYGPGGIENPQDSDGDGIFDYLDQDDDNDNVLTKLELLDDLDEDGDGDPLTNPLNTDGDIYPNYLDNDDDGDGKPTRLEDMTDAQNPRSTENEVTNSEGIDVYRYLSDEPNATEQFEDNGFIFNIYTRSASTRFEILNAGLEIINSTYIDMGSFENAFEISNEPIED